MLGAVEPALLITAISSFTPPTVAYNVVPSASVVKTTLISPILVIFLMSSAQKKYSIPVTALSSFSTPGVPSVLFFAQVVNGEFKSLTNVQ